LKIESHQESLSYTDGDALIDLKYLFYKLYKNAIWIIAFSVLLSTFTYIYARAAFKEEYYSEVTLAFIKKQVDSQGKAENEGEVDAPVFRPYMERDVERYRFLLKSDLMIETVESELGGRYNNKEIEDAISVETTDAAGVFNVRFSSKSKDLCTDLAETVPKAYSSYIEDLDPSLAVEKVKSTKETVLLKNNGAEKKSVTAFVIGLVLSAGFVAAVSLVRESFVWPEDIEEKGSLNLLGEYDGIDTFRGSVFKFERQAELFNCKNILITQFGTEDEKQFFVLNMAELLANKGKKVLLLDINQKEENARFFGESRTLSFEKYFGNTAIGLKDVICKPYDKELYFAGISDSKDFPCYLLNNKKFVSSYFKLADYFDYVFILQDGKLKADEIEALSVISDAAVISVSQGFGVKEFKLYKNQIEMFGIKLLGAVFIISKKDRRLKSLHNLI